MNTSFLKSLRHCELKLIMPEIEKTTLHQSIILEIGAGAGWQSQKLSECGYDIESIDLETVANKSNQVQPVTSYDGHNIPFPDNHFDVVFSSSVLEHIPHVIEFQDEIRRVLKKDGVAIHILPNTNWRLWTTLSHYPFLMKSAISSLFETFTNRKNKPDLNKMGGSSKLRELSMLESLKRCLYAPRHGEEGNVISELYYFSKARWIKLFINTGWTIKNAHTNQLFYTGNGIFESSLSLETRKALSHFLGSSCHIFILSR